MTTLKELLKFSRSYRSFDRSVPVTEELLCELVDHTRYAPSSMNLQMLKYRLVTNERECRALLPCYRLAGKLNDIKLPPKGNEPTAYIVICTDCTVIPSADTFLKDVGICAQTIMLAAAEKGLGGCMIGAFDPKMTVDVLGLPEHLAPKLLLALGKPAEKVVITPPAEDGSVTYYRENEIHYVQKRNLKDLIIK